MDISSANLNRKLAAILAADVVGYSRLMSEHEERTLHALDQHLAVFHKAVPAYGGRIFGGAGDSIIAEFPSAVEAVRCAVEVQRAFAGGNPTEDERLRFRMGIHVGDVIVQGDNLMGDGVNVAARLESIAYPGGISVSVDVYRQVRNKIEAAFEDAGRCRLKNIPEPLQTYRVVLDGAQPDTQRQARGRWRAWTRGSRQTALAMLSVAVAGTLLWYVTRPTSFPTVSEPVIPAVSLPSPDKPAIAVLPFENLSSSPDQEYFSDGVTEDIISALSKVSGLSVIARSSVFGYKGIDAEHAEVARNLGVRYVLEGSIRRAGGQLRINAKLIDTETGLHLWAEHFDGNPKDVFALQDSVAQNVVSALSIQLTDHEQEALAERPTASLEAHEQYLLGRWTYGSYSKQENNLARKMYERAITLDPNFALAYGALALTYIDDFRRGWGASREESVAKAVELAEKAVAIDEKLPQAHFALGYVSLYIQGQHERAIEEATKAITLDPNYANGYALLSSAYYFSGHPEKSLPLDQVAMRLDPGASFIYYMHLGRGYYLKGQHEEAVAALTTAVEKNYNYIPNHLWLAATYSQMGNNEEASWEAEQVLTLDPDFSISNWVETRPYKNPEHLQQLLLGLRKAGLPD